MSEPPLGPWAQLMNDVLSGKYERAEDVVRRIVEIGGSDPRENAANAPKPAKSTPEERLSRIAQAHTLEIAVGGMTSGLCVECYHNYPCPTYIWASEAGAQRSFLDTWDPIDDDDERPW
jgi:hypothetical protein